LSGQNNTTGSDNSFFGHNAGDNITSGSGNVIIGANAGPTSANNSTNLRLYIDSDLDNFNGNDTPLIYGEFDNDLVAINGTLRLGPTNHINGDDGLIASPVSDGADIVLAANDAVVIEIGSVASESGTFEIWDQGNDDRILFLSESGNLTIDGTLNEGSNINRKENIVPIIHNEVLNKVKELPISQWQYKGESIRHLGPMAQDFYKAFELGLGETTISNVDANGVSLAAIKALAQKNDRLKKQNADILKRLEILESLINR